MVEARAASARTSRYEDDAVTNQVTLGARRRGSLAIALAVAFALVPTFTTAEAKSTHEPGLLSRWTKPVELTFSHPYNPILWQGPIVSGEPVVEIGDDGTVYVAGAGGVGTASPVWYSTDGRRFAEMETPGHVREWTIGAEGDLAIDDQGHVFFVDTYVGGLIITRWSGPDQWDFTLPIAGLQPALHDRPWLTWSNGRLLLYVNHGDELHIYSSTDGIVWVDEGALAWKGTATGQPYFPGHMSADGDNILVGGVVRDTARQEVVLAATYRAGGQWREAKITHWPRKGGLSSFFPGITAIAGDGTGYITWSQYAWSGRCSVYYSYTRDQGRRWSPPIRVSRGGCATFPWLTVDGSDVVMAWYQTQELGAQAPSALSKRAYLAGFPAAASSSQDQVPHDAHWFVHAAVVERSASRSSHVTRTRVPTDGPVYIGPLERALWDFFEVEVSADGRIHIVYTEDAARDGSSSWYVSGHLNRGELIDARGQE